MSRKTVLTPSAKMMSDRELLEKLILAIADLPQAGYYLWKHGLVFEKEVNE